MRLIMVLAALAVAVCSAVAQPIAGFVQTHTVADGESLASIAARFGIELRTLARDNELAVGSVVRAGNELLVDNRHIVPSGTSEGVVVNVPQRMLFVFRGGMLAAAFPIAVGRKDWPTPIGDFAISSKEVDPTWDVPVSIQREMASAGRAVVAKVPPGPANPLGDRWLGLTAPGVGLHGTNQPTSIYRFTTHGCIRLHPSDVAVLFDLVSEGTSVRIVYEPVLAAVLDTGDVVLEVHPDVYGLSGNARKLATRVLEGLGLTATAEDDAVLAAIRARAGRAVVVVPGT